MAKINKIQLDGASYDIRGLIPEVVSSLPVTGEEDMLYLTPAAEPGTRGVTVETSNGYAQIANAPANAPITLETLNGNTTQETLSGVNMFDVYDTDGGQVQDVSVDADGWLTCTIDNTSGTGTKYGLYFTNNLVALQTNTTYAIVMEVKAKSGTGSVFPTQGSGAQCQFTVNKQYQFSDISAGQTYIFTQATKADFTGTNQGLRSVVAFSAGQSGSITFRLSVLADTSITPQTFTYQPFTGNVPSPNPDYPQPVEVVSGGQLVQVAGKNLFNFQEFAEAKTQPGGVSRGTATVSGNSITITATQYDAFTTYSFTQELPPIFKVPKNTEMVLSWVSDNTTANQKGMVYIFGMNESGGADVIKNAQDIVNRVQFNTGKYDTISFRLGTTAVGDSITYSNIQLEYGMTPSEYEPYQGTQQYEVNLGKNLINISDLADANITVSNGVATGTGNQFYASYGQASDGVPYIKEEGQLAVSFKAYTDGNVSTANTSGLVCRIVYTDGTDGVIIYCKNNETTSVLHKATTAPGKNVASIELTYANDGGNIWHVSELQIERGPVTTTYAPYKTPIELAGVGEIQPDGLPKYRDGFRIIDGTWYIHKEVGKVVLTGAVSESWNYASGAHPRFEHNIADIALAEQSSIAPIVCDHFVADSISHIWSGADYKIGVHYSNKQIWVSDSDYTSVSGFKTWLSTHNTTVYYPLATPTDTEITDSELIEQLDFVASLYEGVNNLMLIPSAGAQGEMTLVATEYDPQQRYDEYVWVEGEGYEKVGYGSVDTALSLGSTNPVQNKVITEVIGDVESILRILNSGNGV